MKLIVGLGNPGTKYTRTRHNIGRSLVEWIAKENELVFSKKVKLKAWIASLTWAGESVLLAFPETYMNLSGQSVQSLVDYYSLDARSDLLVVIDEYALPFGKMRLRGKGSDGGHNGLKSVEASVGHPDYPRLRLGIGPEASDKGTQIPLEKFVLEVFTQEEREKLPDFLQRAYQAAEKWVSLSLDKAMMAVNSEEA